jgi:hypothetical protein
MRDPVDMLPVDMLVVQFLEWVAAGPRVYDDVMAAWRTSCPRLQVWENAIDGDLVRIDYATGIAMADCPVVLTALGRATLAAMPAGTRTGR